MWCSNDWLGHRARDGGLVVRLIAVVAVDPLMVVDTFWGLRKPTNIVKEIFALINPCGSGAKPSMLQPKEAHG
jgi:hypothetical protein